MQSDMAGGTYPNARSALAKVCAEKGVGGTLRGRDGEDGASVRGVLRHQQRQGVRDPVENRATGGRVRRARAGVGALRGPASARFDAILIRRMDGLGATTLCVPVPSDTLFRPTATFAEENPSSRAAARLVVVHIWARGPAVRGRVRRVGVAMMPPERSGVTPLVSQVRPPSALIFPRVAARGFYSLSPRSSSEDRRRPTTVASDVDPLVRAFLRSPLYRASPRVLPDDPSSPFPDFFSSSWTSRTRARRARARGLPPHARGPRRHLHPPSRHRGF